MNTSIVSVVLQAAWDHVLIVALKDLKRVMQKSMSSMKPQLYRLVVLRGLVETDMNMAIAFKESVLSVYTDRILYKGNDGAAIKSASDAGE